MGFRNSLVRGLFTTAAVVAMFALVGCGGSSDEQAGDSTQVVSQGDSVSMTYVGTLDDGSVFDSTAEGQPFRFVAGVGAVIPGFDQAVLGMKLNETKTFTIPDSLAYGPYHEEAVRKVPNSFFPEDMKPEVGLKLQLADNQGRPFPAKIAAMDADSVTLDMNHDLAGEDLTFKIEIVGIN